MVRIVIIIAVVSVVLAVGTVTAVTVVLHSQPLPEDPPQNDADVAALPVEDDLAEAPASAAAPAVAPPPEAVPDEAPPAEEETAGEDEPIEDEAFADDDDAELFPADDDVKTRVAALIDSMTDEELREFDRQRRSARWQERRERSRRALPADHRLRTLGRLRGRYEDLQLNEAQETLIANFREVVTPRLELALQDVWAQKDAVRKEAGELKEQGLTEEAKVVWQRYGELSRQERDIKDDINQQYLTMLGGVLTDEQMTYVEKGKLPQRKKE